MEEATSKPMSQDHDLLIRLDQKVEGLIDTVDKLNDTTIKRVGDLEHGRVTTVDFEDFKKTLKDTMTEMVTSTSKRDDDIEQRMRSSERFMYMAFGILTVVNLIGVPFILKFLLK